MLDFASAHHNAQITECVWGMAGHSMCLTKVHSHLLRLLQAQLVSLATRARARRRAPGLPEQHGPVPELAFQELGARAAQGSWRA